MREGVLVVVEPGCSFLGLGLVGHAISDLSGLVAEDALLVSVRRGFSKGVEAKVPLVGLLPGLHTIYKLY